MWVGSSPLLKTHSQEGGSSSKCWWNNFLQEEDQLDDIKFGNKMVLLMEILRECVMVIVVYYICNL